MSAPGPDPVAAALGAAQASEPAWVRSGSAEVQREYTLGLEFERLLVQQLATSLTETTEPSGEGENGEGSSGGATSTLSSMLPGALADGVVNGGGLGLAAELTKGMNAQAGSGPAQTGATGTTQPSGGVEAGSTDGARS
jgi:Rod binding domain-containing protein